MNDLIFLWIILVLWALLVSCGLKAAYWIYSTLKIAFYKHEAETRNAK
jgi:hypothetical protein